MAVTFATLVYICLGVSAIIGAATLVWRLGRAGYKGAVRIGRVVDDLLGEEARPGILPEEQRRKGVIELVRAIVPQVAAQAELIRQLTARVAAIEAQLMPGPGTVRDSVDRVREAVAPQVPAPRVESTGGLMTERADGDTSEQLTHSYGFR